MPSHTFLMAHMNFGEHPSKTREATAKIAVSRSSRCTWNCIFTHAEAHDGVPRARNTNLSALAFENMWCQHILIELLAVLVLLHPHIPFPPVPPSFHVSERRNHFQTLVRGVHCNFTAQRYQKWLKTGVVARPKQIDLFRPKRNG